MVKAASVKSAGNLQKATTVANVREDAGRALGRQCLHLQCCLL
jgi:hypothetical protein